MCFTYNEEAITAGKDDFFWFQFYSIFSSLNLSLPFTPRTYKAKLIGLTRLDEKERMKENIVAAGDEDVYTMGKLTYLASVVYNDTLH